MFVSEIELTGVLFRGKQELNHQKKVGNFSVTDPGDLQKLATISWRVVSGYSHMDKASPSW